MTWTALVERARPRRQVRALQDLAKAQEHANGLPAIETYPRAAAAGQDQAVQ